MSDQAVRLTLHVRRFRCLNPHCVRRTFAERLPDVVPAYAQRSRRLITALQVLALAMGGEAGARVANQLRMPVSPDTLLRFIQHMHPVSSEQPRVVGIDDWAWHKGRSYGTIVVDLERHRPVDLLPDRSAKTLAQWLRAHPEVEIVSRDRSIEYARGILDGAPQALQVVDRWHLVHNLRQALERLLDRHRQRLLQLPRLPGSAPADKSHARSGPVWPRPYRRSPGEQAARRARDKRRRERYQAVKGLYSQGRGIREIARRLKMNRATVRRLVTAGAAPERVWHRRSPSILEPYLPYLQSRWDSGCTNGLQLWREIQAQGFSGSRRRVAQWVQAHRTEPAPTTPTKYLAPTSPRSQPVKRGVSHPSLPPTQQLAWLLLKTDSELTKTEQATMQHVRQEREIEIAYQLAQQFRTMIRNREPEVLNAWLAAASTVPELNTFGAGLQRDQASVLAALSTKWSNGQTEGHVNRLKMFKRQMYGRAGFGLLRQRVLLAA